MKNTLLFSTFVSQAKTTLTHLACFTAITNILMLVPSIYMLQVYDRVLSSGNTMTLWAITGIMIALIILIGALEYIRQIVLLYLASELDKKTGPDIYDAVFQQKLNGSSQAQVNALDDLNLLRQFITGPAPAAFFDLPWFPIYLVILYAFHPWLGHFALMSAVLLIIITYFNERVVAKSTHKSTLIGMAANYQFQTQMQHVETAHALGIKHTIKSRWTTFQNSFIDNFTQGSKSQYLVNQIAKTLRMIVQSSVLGLGAWLVIDGQITAGMMIAASILLGRVLSPVDQIIVAWKQWVTARHAMNRLNELLNQVPVKHNKSALPEPTGALSLSNVVAAPPHGKIATLRGINFTLEKGDILSISGESGSGKSTLARALLGIWPIAQGKIKFDQAEISQWDNHRLSQHLGYVSQEPELFSGTISENIARMNAVDTQSQQFVLSAAHQTKAHELIMSLPKGYDTLLGENGRGLSGGQKQKIALARACYQQPSIIVLDEPDTSLDKNALEELKEIITRWSTRSTIILISHNPDLQRIANKSLVLNRGVQTFFGQNPAHQKRTNTGVGYPVTNMQVNFNQTAKIGTSNG